MIGGDGIKAGDAAGSVDSHGYWRVGFEGKEYRAHRIVMYLEKGIPLDDPRQVDHADRDRLNNKLYNLSMVSNQVNQFNKGILRNNTSGITGVIWYKITGKWKAQMRLNKRNTHLGYFDNLFDAACCRKAAELKHQRI